MLQCAGHVMEDKQFWWGHVLQNLGYLGG